MTLDDFMDSVMVATGPNPLHPTSYEVGFNVGNPPIAVYTWMPCGEYDDGDDIEGAIADLFDVLSDAFGT